MAAILIMAATLAGAVTVGDAPHPASVTVGAGAEGKLLTTPAGAVLYTYDGDAEGNPCANECLNSWRPFAASPGEKSIGEWTPYPRSGVIQWTYKKNPVYLPVYTYIGDSTPNVAAGDGLGGVWHAMRYTGPTPRVPVPPVAAVTRQGSSFILTDNRGFALYSFSRDGRTPTCRAECLEVWPPLLAAALARPVGQWTPVERADGLRQWAYRGRLVYTFSEDLAPGDSKGAGLGGVWQTITVTQRDAAKASTSEVANKDL